MNDFCVARLNHEEHWKRTKGLSSIRIRLVEFLKLNEEQRIRFLLDTLLTESGARYLLGVGRFERILRELDLGGPVPEAGRDDERHIE